MQTADQIDEKIRSAIKAVAATNQLAAQFEAVGFSDVITEGMELEGRLKMKPGANLVILGKFVGDIESGGVVLIGERGEVRGTVTADTLAIAGSIDNSGIEAVVHARKTLVLGTGSRLNCDRIMFGAIDFRPGAVVRGQLESVSRPRPAAVHVQSSAHDAAPAPVRTVPAEPHPGAAADLDAASRPGFATSARPAGAAPSVAPVALVAAPATPATDAERPEDLDPDQMLPALSPAIIPTAFSRQSHNG